MAQYLQKGKRCDLLKLAQELDIAVPENATVKTLKQSILQHETYDLEETKAMLDHIIEERLENEEAQRVREEREFELQKIRAAVPPVIAATSQDAGDERSKRWHAKDITKLIGKFQMEDDVQVFLSLFERQVKRLSIPENDWVMCLLGLLPLPVIHLVTKEGDEDANNYEHVKKIILQRYKWTTEEFRRRFFLTKKLPNTSWKELAFQLKEYLDQWMLGTDVTTVEQLKELLVTNQIKYRAPEDVQKHFIDKFPKLNKIAALLEKLEEYDAVRTKKRADGKTDVKKSGTTFQQRRSTDPKIATNSGGQNNGQNSVVCFRCKKLGHRSFQCVAPSEKR